MCVCVFESKDIYGNSLHEIVYTHRHVFLTALDGRVGCGWRVCAALCNVAAVYALVNGKKHIHSYGIFYSTLPLTR